MTIAYFDLINIHKCIDPFKKGLSVAAAIDRFRPVYD